MKYKIRSRSACRCIIEKKRPNALYDHQLLFLSYESGARMSFSCTVLSKTFFFFFIRVGHLRASAKIRFFIHSVRKLSLPDFRTVHVLDDVVQ